MSTPQTTAAERRGLRLALLIVALASVALAILSWSPWPLAGLIIPAVTLTVIRPGTRKARDKSPGPIYPKG